MTLLRAPAVLVSARLLPTPALLRPAATLERPVLLGSAPKQAGPRPAAAALHGSTAAAAAVAAAEAEAAAASAAIAAAAAAAVAAAPAPALAVTAVGEQTTLLADDHPAAEPGLTFHTGSLDTYAIIQKVGQGSYGEVFKAERRHTPAVVALKKSRLGHDGEGFPITTFGCRSCRSSWISRTVVIGKPSPS